MKPWLFRPENDDRVDVTKEDATDWEDNWLSNTFAWASWKYVPRWCENKDHFTTLLSTFLFTTCPCCAMWRGLFLGLGFATALWWVLFVLYLVVR